MPRGAQLKSRAVPFPRAARWPDVRSILLRLLRQEHQAQGLTTEALETLALLQLRATPIKSDDPDFGKICKRFAVTCSKSLDVKEGLMVPELWGVIAQSMHMIVFPGQTSAYIGTTMH